MINLPFDLKVTRSNKRRFSSTLTVRNNQVRLRVPSWFKDREIESILSEKLSWINKHLSFNSRPQTSFSHNSLHLYLGNEYPLLHQKMPGLARPKLNFDGDIFQASVPFHHSDEDNENDLKRLFRDWYHVQAEIHLYSRVEHYTSLLGLKYGRITLKNVSSIWGSCSSKGNLNFNKRLILAPKDAVDYVVAHEVCHLIHHHHQPSFWKLVASVCPDYKKHVRYFKQHGSSLDF